MAESDVVRIGGAEPAVGCSGKLPALGSGRIDMKSPQRVEAPVLLVVFL
jgi:hypothetical protein